MARIVAILIVLFSIEQSMAKQPEISLNQGDTLQSIHDVASLWLANGKIVCENSLTCSIPTSQLSLGQHELEIMWLQSSEQYNVLKIILTINQSIAPLKTHSLDIKGFSKNIKTLKTDDNFILSLIGTGFLYQENYVQMIKSVPINVLFSEVIRSHVDSVLAMSIFNQGEVYLLPRTTVSLAKSEANEKAIILDNGSLRVLAKQSMRDIAFLWGRKVQVIAKDPSDFIMHIESNPNEGKSLVIAVLRGEIFLRIFDNEKNHKIVMKGPSELTVSADQKLKTTPIGPIISQAIAQDIEISSPNVVEKRFAISPVNDFNILPIFSPSLGRINGNDNQQEAFAKKDYILVLKTGLQKPNKTSEDKFQLGASSLFLGLFAQAKFYLNEKLSESPTSDAHVLYAIAQMHTQNWKEARRHLAQAYSLAENRHDLISYYRGVNAYYADEMESAYWHFAYSLWKSQDSSIISSSKQFIENNNLNNSFHTITRFLVFRHNNPDKDSGVPSFGRQVASQNHWKLWQLLGLSQDLKFDFDDNRFNHFENLSLLSYKLGSKFEYEQKKDSLLKIDFLAHLGQKFLNGNRRLDFIGHRESIEIGSILKITLGYDLGFDSRTIIGADNWDIILNEKGTLRGKSHRKTVAEIDLNLLKIENHHLFSEMKYHTIRFNSDPKPKESFNHIQVSLNYEYRLGLRLKNELSSSFDIYQFLEERKDLAISFLERVSFELFPRFPVFGQIYHEKKTSSVNSGYGLLSYGLGISYER